MVEMTVNCKINRRSFYQKQTSKGDIKGANYEEIILLDMKNGASNSFGFMEQKTLTKSPSYSALIT